MSDADPDAWRGVFVAVVPNEPAATVEQMRKSARKDLLRVLAEVDGDVVGSGVAAPLNHGRLHLAPAWQRAHAHMRRLNEHLGYVTRSVSISVRAPLPLQV